MRRWGWGRKEKRKEKKRGRDAGEKGRLKEDRAVVEGRRDRWFHEHGQESGREGDRLRATGDEEKCAEEERAVPIKRKEEEAKRGGEEVHVLKAFNTRRDESRGLKH